MNTRKLIYGIGINDAEYKTKTSSWANGKTTITWQCPIYKMWVNMLARCMHTKMHENRPTYIGCSVCDEWVYFSNFRDWVVSQPWRGNQIDKDILIAGNKIYSPELCVLIPQKLNGFLTDRRHGRGEWPLGVSSRGINKFQATCSNPFTGKNENLGSFSDPEEAHLAWRKRKNQHACRYADMQTDRRIADALRKRFA